MAEPRYSMTWPMPPPVPIAPMIVERDVLGGHTRGSVALDGDGHRLRPYLGQRLRRQHVLDLARPDAEGQGAEGAVGRGVAVAADDGHAGLRPPLFGTDDVDDPLVGVTHRVAGDAELGRVGVEHLELLGRDGVGQRLVDVGGGHVVVRRGHGQVGTPHRPARQPYPVEGLGRGHLVHEVEIDEEEIGFSLGRADDVVVPDLLAERARRHQVSTATMCTVSMPPGARYSTVSPAPCPTRTCPSGELGEITGRSACRSSMEPTKKRWVSSSSSPS